MLKSTDNADFPLIVDSTMRSAYASCPTRFYWEFIRQIAPRERSIHLHFGASFAKALEVFRRTYYALHEKIDKPEAFVSAEVAGFRALCVEYGDYEDEEGQRKNFVTCVMAYLSYVRHYPPETDFVKPYMTEAGIPAVEFTFAFPLSVNHPRSDEPLLYAGRFDMLGVFNEQLFVLDDKTASQLGGYWSQQWDLRGQFLGYCYAARTFGFPVAGAIARGTAIKAKGIEHVDAVVPLPAWLLDNWWEQVQYDISSAVADWAAQQWPQNFDQSCTAYGGCPYKVLCTSPEPERWISTNFVRRHWNPVASDPTRPEDAAP